MNKRISVERFLSAAIYAVSLLLLSGCFRYVNITTSSYVDKRKLPQGFPQGSSFCVVFSQKNSLLSKEIAYKIEDILKSKGYSIDGAEDADYYLFFDYGCKSEKGSRIVPIVGPGKTKIIHGNVDGIDYQEQTMVTGDTTFVQEQYTYFIRSLSIQVFEAHVYREVKKEEQIWQGATVNTGNSCDLREVLDYLFAAVFSYFGKDTGQAIEMSFSPTDDAIKNLQKIYN